MRRPTNTALKMAGIVLVLSGLSGALTGCSGSDGSDGGSASGDGASSGASDTVTKAGFCEKLNALGPAVSTSGSSDATAFKRLKAWIADMEDYGTPSELSDDERKGVAILVALFKQVDKDTSQADFQNLGKDLSKDDQKKMDEFSAWANKNCVTTSSSPSPTTDPSGDAS